MTPAPRDMKAVAAGALEDARRRSLGLLAPVPDDDLRRQHSPLMSPLVWDLAHVGNYEEQWLLGAVAGERAAAHLDPLYDAFLQPRATRPSLPILGPREARAYVDRVRERVVESLDRVELDPVVPLLRDAFVYGMVVQHEHQHDETMLATLQLRGGDYPVPSPAPLSSPALPAESEVLVPGGPFVMGTDDDPWAYDNERPAHVVDVAPFRIDTAPVTNGAYLDFVESGAYDEPRWWSPAGWSWRQESGATCPQFWVREARGSWGRDRFGRREGLAFDEPVQHVCWYEAEAYARWAGKRLPTEAEWEKAASWTPGGHKRPYPWGRERPTTAHANLDGGRFSPAPVGSFPAGASAFGCHQLLGDVWEWTASDFGPYPGFRSFPYAEYSEVFFGATCKVLRGGSWATSPLAVRTTFRNWDFPVRRQIFAGFRCARDA